jgi:hypothetical protein
MKVQPQRPSRLGRVAQRRQRVAAHGIGGPGGKGRVIGDEVTADFRLGHTRRVRFSHVVPRIGRSDATGTHNHTVCAAKVFIA